MSKLSVSLCSVEGCVSRVTGKGLCNLHYRRLRRHGDPLGGRETPKGAPIEFLMNAVTAETDDCVIWPYSAGKTGYGTLFFNGKNHSAHRLSLILASGEPTNRETLATHLPGVCHNRRCINPRHLRWGTHTSNAADQAIDGTKLLGERTNSGKLTADAVKEIRLDTRHPKIVAEYHGVTADTVYSIRRRRTWAWLP